MSAGLYIHLPYCASRCGYCAFVVTTEDSSRAAYLEALRREMEILRPETDGTSFDTVYLGGGTPSLLPPEDLARLLDAVRARLSVEPGAEVTLEANPEDVTGRRRDAWIAAGVTRVSVGVQSFEDRELSAVGRRHDARRAAEALAILARRGLSLSGDLILGLPGQTGESFRRSLDALCGAGVEHVSVYLLETEKSKAIEQDRRRRPERYLSDDAQAEAWLSASQRLAGRGFRHYEISNWALPGRQSRHNRKYWERLPTIGLGVSAHEFWGGRRRANVSALPAYLERLREGLRPTALDRELAPGEEAGERIVLGLRLSRGVGRERIEAWISGSGDPRLAEDYAAWRQRGLLREEEGRLRLSEEGFLLSNEILCRFV